MKYVVRSPEHNTFVATLDACVLAPSLHRNLLLSFAEAKLFEPKWSEEILIETEKAIGNIVNDRREGKKQRKRIENAFVDAIVSGYKYWEKNLELEDINDIHVLAATKHSISKYLVTDNLQHFPADYLISLGITVMNCDEFLSLIISNFKFQSFLAIEKMRGRLLNPKYTFDELIDFTKLRNLPKTAEKMRLLKNLYF